MPIFRENSLQTGLFELPVTTDPPSSEARQHSTESSAPALSTLKVYILYILNLNPRYKPEYSQYIILQNY